MQTISPSTDTLIFDLGGVILNIDHEAAVRAFAQVGRTSLQQTRTILEASSVFQDLETGSTSPESFLNILQKLFPCRPSTGDLTWAWNQILLDFPADRISWLKKLRKKFRLFLLSNTNALHVEAFNLILQKQHGIPDIAELFDKVYYSHEMGTRKPQDAIFRQVIDENKLSPETCLFLEDTQENIEAARRNGLKTIAVERNKPNYKAIFSQFPAEPL